MVYDKDRDGSRWYGIRHRHTYKKDHENYKRIWKPGTKLRTSLYKLKILDNEVPTELMI